MSARASGREIRVGLVVVAALAALMGLLALAGGGPGFLADRRQIDVDFKNGQGIRPGSQVRIAGVESGRVVAVTLAEVDGSLRARVRLAVPADLAHRMKEDARIAIESSLTGQTRVNILSIGQSHLALKPGKVLLGVETSMFDPILEQVGLGPVERSNISHIIGEIRETLDDTTPRVRQIVGRHRDHRRRPEGDGRLGPPGRRLGRGPRRRGHQADRPGRPQGRRACSRRSSR